MDKYIKLNNSTIVKIGDPNKKHVILNSKLAKKYLGYLLIKEDLNSVLDALIKLRTIDFTEEIIRESLSFYIVITYGKDFAKADIRKIKLDKHQLKNLTEDQVTLHDILIDIRNKHVAHAGSEIFSLTNLITQFDDNSLQTFVSGLSLSSFNFNINSIENLVNEVLKICDNKSHESYQTLAENFLSKEEAQKLSFLPNDYQFYSFEEIQSEIVILNKNYYENKK